VRTPGRGGGRGKHRGARAFDGGAIGTNGDGRQHGPGDQFIFAGDVFDRPGGVFLGRTAGVCTTLTGNDKAGQQAFSGTINLPGGQIALQGLVDTAALLGRGDTVPLYITGGNGIYRDARGDATIQVPPDVPNETDANFVLNVITG
jgi:hypothetical protein